MKVKIIKVSNDLAWYKDSIGHVFEVKDQPSRYDEDMFYIVDSLGRGILYSDCEIIKNNMINISEKPSYEKMSIREIKKIINDYKELGISLRFEIGYNSEVKFYTGSLKPVMSNFEGDIESTLDLLEHIKKKSIKDSIKENINELMKDEDILDKISDIL